MNISFMAFPYPETEIVLSMVGEDIELSQIMMVILPQLPPIPEVDLEDDLTEMLEGIIAMEEGLNELYEGADQIYQGLDQFRSKSNEMLARMKPMIALIEKLPLYEKQIPKAGEIRTHIEELRDYLDNLPDDWPERPDQWPDEWPDDWPERPDQWPDDWPDDWPDQWPDDWPDDWPELPDGLAEEISSYLKTAAEFLEELENLESYLSEAESTLSQLSALPEALDQLAGGQKAVRDGIEEVNRRGISEMKKGLIEGVNESRFGKAKIDLMESLADGYRSHADNENNRESSVQFILQTENAKQNNQETPGAGEKEDQPGDKGKTWYARLWSRFLDLFPQYANK
ncbi:MAG: hypothetical protein GX881_09115, partial [Firmicutes bacterium]|nr:hypothetical protein [Bacillota bacterium]